jgi:hypothetical protein
MRKNHTASYQGNTIPWIEKLLETPIDDYRKNAVNLILSILKNYLMMWP